MTPEAVAALAACDERLAGAIALIGPCTLKRGRGAPYEALLSAIAHQQIHGSAAAAILGRFRERCGQGRYPAPAELVATPDAQLRACGLSRAKVAAMKDVAAKTLDGTVPTLTAIRRMPDDEIIERLTEVRGVGTWTVQMLLIFRLGRPDILPVTDYGVRKGFALTFLRLPKSKPFDASMLASAEQIERRAAKWRPWRSVASWYLWRACDLTGKTMALPD